MASAALFTVSLTVMASSFLPTRMCDEGRELVNPVFRPDKFLENENYDKWSRPGNYTSPLKVKVRMYFYFLGPIEAQKLQFTANVLIRYKWKDERLIHGEGLIEGEGPVLLHKIWTPHIYIVNEHKSKIMGSGKDILITIDKSGNVIYSIRMQVTLLCLMNLKKFPFDYQLCPFVLESWGYNSSDIFLEWDDVSPVAVNRQLELTEYILTKKWIHETNNSYIIPVKHEMKNVRYSRFFGNYSSLTVTFRFEREVGHYIMDYYVPSMLLVVVSWVSFWLDPNAVPGRTTLGTSTMLTFITLSRNIGTSLPKVSYIKATEIWFIVCTGFIFGSLVEFAFVNTIWRRRTNVELKKVNSHYILKSTLTPQIKRRDMSSSDTNISIISQNDSQLSSTINLRRLDSTMIPGSFTSISEDPNPSSTENSFTKSSAQKGLFTLTPQEIAQWIDRRSRFFFPCSFIAFNCLYWIFVYIEF